ncbi:MAG: DUF327 family protein [Treponema sp.]|jgi:uncharacterized protein YaaR (DUF327 family)|nr:DUF327 family protein [Treponema sp.]
MAKIDFSNVLNPFFNPALNVRAKSETRKTKSKPLVSFDTLLDEARQDEAIDALLDTPESDEVVQEMLDAVHSTGDALKNRPLPEEILRYKQAVRAFIHYIAVNGYGVERHVRGSKHSPRGQRIEIVAQVVDNKLEQLAAGILAGQTSQMGILNRLEEITGLLVDLMQ